MLKHYHCLLISFFGLIIQIPFSQTFEPPNFANDFQEWQISGFHGESLYSYCGSTQLFGGYNQFKLETTLMKLYFLPPHYRISIQLNFWKIDRWQNQKFLVFVDQIVAYESQPFTIQGTPKCGQSPPDLLTVFAFSLYHSFNSVIIILTANSKSATNNESWGIRDFKMQLDLCPPGCLTCNPNDTQFSQCQGWVLAYSSLSDNSLNYQSDGWHSNTGYSDLITIYGQCRGQGFPALGKFVQDNQLELINRVKLPNHTVMKIRFRYIFTADFTSKDQAIFKFNNQVKWEIFVNKYWSGIQYINNQLIPSCYYTYEQNITNADQINEFYFSMLLESGSSSSFNIRDFQIYIYCQFGDSISQYCGQTCNNGQIEGTEICDDGNNEPFDGCFNCEYSCQLGCQNCVNGICIECLDDWNFNIINQNCEPKCDNNKIEFYEQCDDILQNGICKQCQFICPQNCLQCQFGICINCYEDYLLNKTNNQCDIINHNKDCQKECLLCNQGTCMMCINEWILNQSYICEQIEYIQCPQNCINCQEEQCQECEYGYQLYFKENYCQVVCGDGITVNNIEQCDDGNLNNGDGCSSQCEQEINYIYQNTTLSDCTYEGSPIFQANYLSKNQTHQFVQLKFNQKVKLNTTLIFSNYISMQLINVSNDSYCISLQTIQEATIELNNVEYIALIQIYDLISYPIFQVILKKQLYNINNEQLSNLEQQVILKQSQYQPNSNEQKVVGIFMDSANIGIKVVGSISILSFLFGNQYILWGIIDILQQLSYLKFINVVYPLNLLHFFEITEQISLQPLLNIFQFYKITNNMLFQETYIKSYGKLLYYQINADFITNIQTQIFQLISLLLFYLLSQIILKILHKIDLQITSYKQNIVILKMKQFVFRCLISLQRQFQNTSGWKQLYLANLWDLLFSCLIQIQAYNFATLRQIINLILSILILIVIVFISISDIYKLEFNNNVKLSFSKNKIIFIYLLKKILFLILLISLQSNQYIQVILMNVIYSIYTISILVVNNKKNRGEFISECINEITVILFILSVFLYWDVSLLNSSQQFILGWIHIGLLLNQIFSKIIIMLYDVFVQFKNYIGELRRKKVSNDQQKFNNHQKFISVQDGYSKPL